MHKNCFEINNTQAKRMRAESTLVVDKQQQQQQSELVEYISDTSNVCLSETHKNGIETVECDGDDTIRWLYTVYSTQCTRSLARTKGINCTIASVASASASVAVS